jgi:hypothetical protein
VRFTELQRIPYPLGLDAANGARQLQDMAELLEAKFTDLDAGWSDRNSPAAWQARTTAAQSSFNAALIPLEFHVVDWDSKGTMAPINTGVNTMGRLGTSDRWEHWYIGAYLNFAGGTTLGELCYATLTIAITDPLTGVASTVEIERTNSVTNTAGEQMVLDSFVRVRGATVQVRHFSGGAGTKTIGTGALMWGVQVGVE